MNAPESPSPVYASVAYVTRYDGKILVVWNKRYGRWSMPGGKVENNERIDDAVRRELVEETGSKAVAVELIYEGEHGESVESTRGSHVFVFACTIQGEPSEQEPGCPVTWFTHEEFVRWGLAPSFYRRMFEKFPPHTHGLVTR
jgi:ADP-ribose pyrophosphatase YjhB (NUDIX family)